MNIKSILAPFTNDEIIFMNHIVEGNDITDFPLSKMKEKLEMQVDIIADDADELIKELVNGTFEKVSMLSEEDWNEIVKHFPIEGCEIR